MTALTPRQQAEAIEEFGEALLDALKRLDVTCRSMDLDTITRVNAIPHQEWLDGVARAYRDLGAEMSTECDAAEDAPSHDTLQSGKAAA
jgi:hypothetical protein